jgi:hypothetical protein
MKHIGSPYASFNKESMQASKPAKFQVFKTSKLKSFKASKIKNLKLKT